MNDDLYIYNILNNLNNLSYVNHTVKLVWNQIMAITVRGLLWTSVIGALSAWRKATPVSLYVKKWSHDFFFTDLFVTNKNYTSSSAKLLTAGFPLWSMDNNRETTILFQTVQRVFNFIPARIANILL